MEYMLTESIKTSINDVHTRMNGTKRKRKDKVGDRIMEEPGSQSSNQDTRKSSVDGLPQKRNSEDCDSAGSENISVKKSRRRSVLVNTDCDMHGADILQTPSNSEGELEVARRGGKGTAHEEPKGKGKGKGKKREGEGQKGKSTSTLRPKSTRPTRLASKSAASELLDEDDNTDDVDDNYIPDEAAFDPFRRRNHKGKNAGRSSGKKAGANSFFAEGPESAQDLPDGSDELPLRLKPPPNMNPTEYTSPPPIFEIAIPQSEANRPGDVWQCTFDGCCHEVYGATTDIGGVLIKEHYRNHYFEKQTQLDLVMKEERPHFPVQ